MCGRVEVRVRPRQLWPLLQHVLRLLLFATKLAACVSARAPLQLLPPTSTGAAATRGMMFPAPMHDLGAFTSGWHRGKDIFLSHRHFLFQQHGAKPFARGTMRSLAVRGGETAAVRQAQTPCPCAKLPTPPPCPALTPHSQPAAAAPTTPPPFIACTRMSHTHASRREHWTASCDTLSLRCPGEAPMERVQAAQIAARSGRQPRRGTAV